MYVCACYFCHWVLARKEITQVKVEIVVKALKKNSLVENYSSTRSFVAKCIWKTPARDIQCRKTVPARYTEAYYILSIPL